MNTATNPASATVDPAFDPKARGHSLTVLLRDLPDLMAFNVDTTLIGIRFRVEQVAGAKPFLDASEQARADEWLATAHQAVQKLIGHTG